MVRSHYAAVAFIEAYGSHWMRRKVAVGLHLGTLALTDADDAGTPGAAPSPTGSTATRTGDVVALRGRKRDVVGAGEADSYIWSSPPAHGGEGPSLWLVPADAPGLFVPARPSGDGPRGSGTSTVCADPVLLPAGALLERDGEADGLLSTVRAWLAAMSTAGAGSPTGAPGSAHSPDRPPRSAVTAVDPFRTVDAADDNCIQYPMSLQSRQGATQSEACIQSSVCIERRHARYEQRGEVSGLVDHHPRREEP